MGIVSYSNESKERLLGVPRELLEEHGAVSEEVARAMADGIRKVSAADFGLSVTGIAGPTGGLPQKPVGLVYIALSSENGTNAWKHQFSGSRMDIKLRTSQAALDVLRTSLI
jgi:PncC family amidohydrolase